LSLGISKMGVRCPKRIGVAMKSAVVYVTSGSSYCYDAEVSCNSVKLHNPELPCILATDEKHNIPPVYDEIIQMPTRRYPQSLWYLDSTRYCNLAFDMLKDKYDSLLFLDTDTFCDAPLDDMLRLSERFDICVSHGVNRHTTGKVSNVPYSFPEFEIGVMLVQTNEHVSSLFKDWLELYEANPGVYGNNDQGPLRDALWINKYINMYVLAEEFHARWGFGACVVSRVRIFHSRSCADAPTNAQVAKEINSVGGRRLIHPGGEHMVWWRPVKGEETFKE
jgi:hypothetical protein